MFARVERPEIKTSIGKCEHGHWHVEFSIWDKARKKMLNAPLVLGPYDTLREAKDEQKRHAEMIEAAVTEGLEILNNLSSKPNKENLH